MSKDQKGKVILNVETVENLKEKLIWISSTITFWHFDKLWPTNLIKDVCDSLFYMLENNDSVI